MNIYFENPHIIDTSVIISLIALVSSWIALYFQFFWKTKHLILNVLTGVPDFSSNTPNLHRDIAKNKISLSNSGNTSILLVNINYQTIDFKKNITSTYETNLYPDNIPLLLKPGETILYDVISNTDLFINAIEDSEKTDYDAFKFKVYLKFTVIANDKSANYQILIHHTQYYNPQKVYHQYSGADTGIDVLNKKYLLHF